MDREFCQPKRGKQAPEFGQAVPENSRIVWVLKRPLKVVCTAPCNEQGHLALDHTAQSPVQPDLKYFTPRSATWPVNPCVNDSGQGDRTPVHYGGIVFSTTLQKAPSCTEGCLCCRSC